MSSKGWVLIAAVVSALFVATAGCGSDDDGASSSGGAGGGATCESRGEQFSAGMSKTSSDGSTKVTLVKSDVVPPAQGPNAWTLNIADASGQPITGASVIAAAKMPDHSHPPLSNIPTETDPGVYEVEPAFSMPGLWEIEVKVQLAGGELTSVLFKFCIPQD